MLVAAALGIAAARWDVSGGLWGASRHAFTVGFVSVMVFSIGQRVLPAFAAARPLWSPRLMFIGLLLLNIGCVLRVTSEVIAYQGGAEWWWSVLPASAIIELGAVSAFALNMLATFLATEE
jgi:heme/copper-type cytochrome/quinol oxidase subunit 1